MRGRPSLTVLGVVHLGFTAVVDLNYLVVPGTTTPTEVTEHAECELVDGERDDFVVLDCCIGHRQPDSGKFLRMSEEREWWQLERAVCEAWQWLIRKGLMVPRPEQPDNEARWIRSRLGEQVQNRSDGLRLLKATERIDMELHPRIAEDVRSEFLRFDYQGAVWKAMRQVEIALRETSGADQYAIGKDVLRHAFASGKGTLVDPNLDEGEQEGIGQLFRGALLALKNPHSHREIDFDDPTEAAEIVLFASLLLRILDRLGDAHVSGPGHRPAA